VVVEKLSKVLENINEVMKRLEQQTDSERHHLMRLVNRNRRVLKKENAVTIPDKLHHMTTFVKEAQL
jgi:uncharacterized protein YoxC